ncbi:hypothetical protein SmJEL517_g06101 [Synchytrium microbalum]|uniref:Serine aminopeptidase S33 domain-containing protein n=1 Tax=Synchytrium microbalum TaxID=1806994 RepID=A0A507BSH3_9FUNG|nr:uncharacterized protein SmJEL517_g06101 [Synchytrium microbalum]TPX30311.1 hypothetical protein SmJEL517_g06101 [Synchytrium microbalum]
MSDLKGGELLTLPKDGTKFYVKTWKRTGTPIAVVYHFHGMGEHINRYEHVFSAFAQAGFEVKGLDFMGHGRTQVVNNSVKGATDFETVFAQMDMLVFGTKHNLPVFLMGHSLGGLLVLAYAQSRGPRIPNLRGVICQAPALKVVPLPLGILAKALGGNV